MDQFYQLMQYRVDLDKPLYTTMLGNLFAAGNSNAHKFLIEMYRGQKKLDATGEVVAKIVFEGYDSEFLSAGQIENGAAAFVMPRHFYSLAGLFSLSIIVKNGEDEATVFDACGTMSNRSAGSLIDPDDVLPNETALLSAAKDAQIAAQAATEAAESVDQKVAEANAELTERVELLSDEIEELKASSLNTTTWAGIQKIVRAGLASKIFPVGTQFQVNHSVFGNLVFDVVAHDYLKSSRDPNAHTMTLLQHDLLPITAQYDAPQAFYYADVPLAAGTYNVTLGNTYSSWEAGTYQFTLSQEIPAGGQLCVSGYASAALTSLNVVSYGSQTSTTPLESVPISIGSGGTSLGTFGEDNINNIQRVSYGSNNYKESAVRQLLNSTAAAGSVWTPQTMFDRPPAWASTVAGYAGGLDPDFLSVVTPVTLPCSANNVYEAPDSTITKGTQYILDDMLYFVSRTEVFGTSDVTDGSVLLPFFDGAANTDRVKYRGNSAAYWWLRTPVESNAYYVRIVHPDGTLNTNSASNTTGLAPACTIA